MKELKIGEKVILEIVETETPTCIAWGIKPKKSN